MKGKREGGRGSEEDKVGTLLGVDGGGREIQTGRQIDRQTYRQIDR